MIKSLANAPELWRTLFKLVRYIIGRGFVTTHGDGQSYRILAPVHHEAEHNLCHKTCKTVFLIAL